METKEARPEFEIKQSQDTDVDDKRIVGNKVVYEEVTGSYDFVLESEFVDGLKLFPIKIYHN